MPFQYKKLNFFSMLTMETHAYNPVSWEPEARESLQNQGQSDL